MTNFEQHLQRVPLHGRVDRTAGAGLALSGGGFRAMLFHVGAIRRLYEIGVLRHVARVSSVSGGSITAAQLGLNWTEIHAPGAGIQAFEQHVQDPLVELASSTLDVKSGLAGIALPRRSIAQSLAKRYDTFLNGATLASLPDAPRFVFCATNLGSGSLVRFAKPYTVDYQVGKRDGLDLRLGDIIAASAAFPPFLSPMVIELDDRQALTQQFEVRPGDQLPPLRDTRPYTHRLQLTDGGVYDNLGLQPLDQFHTLLVSDGGGTFSFDASPSSNWLGHMIRCWNVTDNQVRSLRRRELLESLTTQHQFGAFWGIRTAYADYPMSSIPVHPGWASELRSIPTRLAPFSKQQRKQLINWAYCLTDAAIRSHLANDIEPDPALPYPDAPLAAAPSPNPKRWWKLW